MSMNIPFSPPDLTENEIQSVIDVLKSGWITTGEKTKEFETLLASYCNTKKALCLSSATAGLFLCLKYFGIEKGDEVITTPFTYVATSNVILHCGAKPVFVDVKKDSFFIDIDAIQKKITSRTKAIITVDYGGWPVDYDRVREVISNNKKFKPKKGTIQEKVNRILFVSDAAHSFGAIYNNQRVGAFADFTVFSFHAVKNLTTAEGGAIVFNDICGIKANEIYRDLSLLSLHGQNKSAFEKFATSKWRYDIEKIGYKFNMTDIQAAIGITQLNRYSDMLNKRHNIFNNYIERLKNLDILSLPYLDQNDMIGSKHLFPVRIKGYTEEKRDQLIDSLKERGIATNVHFIPIPMFSAYKKLGYDIKNYPFSYLQYKNLITLPIFSTMKKEQIDYVCNNLKKIL
ncbi:MAG TPA: DegT/DnrJ/EryC1/StrS family aminotransferase [Spirochaetota bacterium]|nr:DegT/DnrJ/EryC1/StrS family aminotransferase [Spirochaetota bacterium]HOL56560.1 DegT/DnrJ/EryC1/StrS family aminotransferase [Spirochaetota bacterium]HPP03977.1 DegT/DnrJ/EryC1/StrS family aminotransferase [Spirochaetota bacterium]